MSELSTTVHITITDIDKNQWNKVVNHSKLGSIFHQYEWLHAIEQTMPYQPRYIVVSKANNLIGVFPNFIIKTPKLPIKILFSIEPGYGGPLYTKYEKDIIPMMLEEIPKICTDRIIAHHILSDNPGFSRYQLLLDKYNYRFNLRYATSIIHLQQRSYKDIYHNYDRRKKRNLKNIKNVGCQIKEESITLEKLQQFYKGYQQVMKRVQGTIYPFTFFKKLKERIPKKLKLFTANIDTQPIGSHLYLIDKKRNTFIAWLLDIQPKNQQFHPSELLHDYAIQYALNNGFKTYDFGYSHADYTNGIFNYKQEFGATASPILLWKKNCSMIPWTFLKKGGNIYKKYIHPKQ